MNIRGGVALVMLLVVENCLSAGCSDKSADPEPDASPVIIMPHSWSRCFGDGDSQRAAAIAVDASGNVIIAGYFYGTADFGGGALASAGDYDIFVAKFGSDGAHLWSRCFGDGNVQRAQAIAVDAAGNIIVAGYFGGSVDFGGGELASSGSADIFVAKFLPDGTHSWSRCFGDVDGQAAFAVAVDPWANIFVSGDFEGAVDFGGGALTSAGYRDIFVAKLDADGNHLWSRSSGDSDDQLATAVAVDALGSVYIAGSFSGAADFGGDALSSAGGYDIFVAKFAFDGAHVWSRSFGDGDDQYAKAVAVDASGSALVTGYFSGAADFGGGALSSAGSYDIYIAKFGSDGAYLWSRCFGDRDSQFADDIAVDASSNIIITGSIWGTINFGGGVLTSRGGEDVFIAKFNSAGKHLGSKRFGDLNSQRALAVDVDSSEDILMAGFFWGTVDFGGGALVSAGQLDIFVAKFRGIVPTGEH